MTCPTNTCKAQCCYNIPFDNQELLAFKDKIVNPVLSVLYLDKLTTLAVTNHDPKLNKCPFLNNDCKCNIYSHRPDICRKFGQIPQLKCKFIKLH